MIMGVVHSLLLSSNKEIDFRKIEIVGDFSASELNIIREIINNSDKEDTLPRSSSWLPR